MRKNLKTEKEKITEPPFSSIQNSERNTSDSESPLESANSVKNDKAQAEEAAEKEDTSRVMNSRKQMARRSRRYSELHGYRKVNSMENILA